MVKGGLYKRAVNSYESDYPNLLDRFCNYLSGYSDNTKISYKRTGYEFFFYVLFESPFFMIPEYYSPIKDSILMLENDKAKNLKTTSECRALVVKKNETNMIIVRRKQRNNIDCRFGKKKMSIVNSFLEQYDPFTTNPPNIDANLLDCFFNPDMVGSFENYLENKGNSANSIAQKMYALRRLEEYLIVDALVLNKPVMPYIKKPKVKFGPEAVLNLEELKRIYDLMECYCKTAKNPDELYLALRDRFSYGIVCTTPGRGEAIAIARERDIDMKNKILFINDKGNSRKNLYLPDEVISDAREFLEIRKEFIKRKNADKEYLFHTKSGKPWSRIWFSEMIDRRANESGIEKIVSGKKRMIGTHTIRRSIACLMSVNDASIQHIARFFDHKNVNTTWNYTRHSRELEGQKAFIKAGIKLKK
jgi:site-specific recombinase XerD